MKACKQFSRPLAILFAAVLCWSALAPRAQAEGIFWYKDLDKASEAAMEDRKKAGYF